MLVCALQRSLPFASGKQDLAKSDLRAMDPQTQRTHIPHEVKAPWAEGHVGHHFAELLQDKRSRKSIARPAAQLLYYMVGCKLQHQHGLDPQLDVSVYLSHSV